jgi:hypothetical protein
MDKTSRDGYCTREIKMRIASAKEVFNKTSKLNIELRNKLVRYFVWSTALYGSETWRLRNWSINIYKALTCGAGGEWRR